MGPRHTTLGAAKTSFLRGIRLGGRQRPNRKKQKKKRTDLVLVLCFLRYGNRLRTKSSKNRVKIVQGEQREKKSVWAGLARFPYTRF